MNKMKKAMRAVVAVLMICALAVAAGCTDAGKTAETKPAAQAEQSSGNKPANKPAEKPKTETKNENIEITLYFPNTEATRLGTVKATVKASDKYNEAVKLLIKGTKKAHLISIFPSTAKLDKVTVKDGLATVNFKEGSFDRFVGGSTGEEMMVASLVDTLTEFDEVKKVLITVDGERIETISGHLDTSEPFERIKDVL